MKRSDQLLFLYTVRGYELLSDPYNLINGFPVGLKAALKQF
jgi:hypothetical protein